MLRSALGQSQQEFSALLGLTTRTVARYELETPPRGPILQRLSKLSLEVGRPDLSSLFEGRYKQHKTLRTNIAEAIRSFRLELGLTQQEFARRADLSAASVKRYETNRTPGPIALARLVKLARSSQQEQWALLFEQADESSEETTYTEMAAAIKRIRSALGDTQDQFSARLNISLNSVSRYERNEVPSQKVLERLEKLAIEKGLISEAHYLHRHRSPAASVAPQNNLSALTVRFLEMMSSPSQEIKSAALDLVLAAGPKEALRVLIEGQMLLVEELNGKLTPVVDFAAEKNAEAVENFRIVCTQLLQNNLRLLNTLSELKLSGITKSAEEAKAEKRGEDAVNGLI